MADRSATVCFEAADVAWVRSRLGSFGLPGSDRLAAEPRAKLAALVESSAADVRPPLDSPRRVGRHLLKAVKSALRRIVWSRTGPALERQAEFNVALIRVAAEILVVRRHDQVTRDAARPTAPTRVG